MKVCTTVSIAGSKLNYLRASLNGSKICIENEGEIEIKPEIDLQAQLHNVIMPDDLLCYTFSSQNAITKHVDVPKASGNQARKMARFQLDVHTQGLDNGPYDCDTIALDRDKNRSHWLLTAQKRSDLETQLNPLRGYPSVSNGLDIKGLDELFKRLIQNTNEANAVVYLEDNQINLYYYINKELGFMRRILLHDTQKDQQIFSEIKRSCLLRELSLPKNIYFCGPEFNDDLVTGVGKCSDIPTKALLLKGVEGGQDINSHSNKLPLLGLAWLRLSDTNSHNIYHEEGEHANEKIDLQRNYCTPLILCLIFFGILYLKDTVSINAAKAQAASLKSKASKLFKSAMPPDNKRKFSEQSYLKNLNARFSKNKSNSSNIHLKEFLAELQIVLNDVDLLMISLNFQPSKGRHQIYGYVKNMEDFEKLNEALSNLKGYTLTPNFRRPGNSSSLGLKVSLSLEAKK